MAHACAQACGRRQGANGYYGTEAQFEASNKARRQKSLDSYLRDVPLDVKVAIASRCKKDLLDLGLNIVLPKPAATTTGLVR